MPVLNYIRGARRPIPMGKKVFNTIAVLILGIAWGVFSKFLDTVPSNELPFILARLDIGNFLGRFAIWILIGVGISIYSNSPVRAAIHVFVFFAGMVSSYYLYSNFIAGFFPRSYAMIWFGLTAVSPLLAFVCWYAKGESKPSFLLSAAIIAVLFNTTLLYGRIYVEVRSILELLVFICGVVLLKRSTWKETILMVMLGIGIAVILEGILPFHFG